MTARQRSVMNPVARIATHHAADRIAKRDGLWRCIYCDEWLVRGERAKEIAARNDRLGKLRLPHVDHALPLARGGRNNFDNLVLSCMRCNLQKNNKTPQEFIDWMLDNENHDLTKPFVITIRILMHDLEAVSGLEDIPVHRFRPAKFPDVAPISWATLFYRRLWSNNINNEVQLYGGPPEVRPWTISEVVAIGGACMEWEGWLDDWDE